MPLHPLAEQRQSVSDWRQIGLGVMSIADMLIKMGIKYGSYESINLCEKIAFIISNNAIKESALLAQQDGAFPKCNIKEIMSTDFFKANTNRETKELVEKYGLRNSQLLTCAPTGSISTMLGVSGGIEPIFANYYTRKTESLHGKDVYYNVYTPIVKKYMDKFHIDPKNLPEYFITAREIPSLERIQMQSVWQRHIDASISSTINLPESSTVEDVKNIYINAWKNGLKGITIFRENCDRVGIITTKCDEEKEEEQTNKVKFDSIIPISRKTIGTTHGNTYCKKCACGTLYITINRDNENHIVESFVSSSKGGVCQASINGINRLISVSLRSGVKVDEIIDQLKGINCQGCIKGKTKGEMIDGLSCSDIIARTLEDFYKNDDLSKNIKIDKNYKYSNSNIITKKEQKELSKNICPECGANLIHEGGCSSCMECGWTKCE
jgi:ribonucleoside-diphosphate reductase alpha chain